MGGVEIDGSPDIIRNGICIGRTGFLSPDVAFHDPRPIVLTEEACHRGSSQAPPRVQDLGGADDGGVVDHRVPRRRARRQGGWDGRGQARGRGSSAGDDGAHQAIGVDVGGLDTGMDQPTYDVGGSSQMFGGVGPQGFADFTTAAVGMDIYDPVSQSEFFRDIADILISYVLFLHMVGTMNYGYELICHNYYAHS
ncbi:uncharacterized protein DS421_20g706100 [Arachis hypogaea]|nr:uncharacterized protein DS421_20g706100 [Arachis hypogaea]